MQDVWVEMLVFGSQNAQHQTGGEVNVLVFIFMYGLKTRTKTRACTALDRLDQFEEQSLESDARVP